LEQLAASLLIWIAAHSTYPVQTLKPPPIELLSPEAMTALYREEAGAPMNAPAVDPRVLGYFRREGPSKGTVYLLRPENVPGAARYANPTENPRFREQLLHELVHYAQWSTGAYERFRCPAEGEWAAFSLGGHYLRELGFPDPIPNREFWARHLSVC
jgi:hypothetical protein